MVKNLRYAIAVKTSLHIEEYLGGNNNTSNDSFFYLEEHDNGARSFHFSSALLSELHEPQQIYLRARQIISIFEGIYRLLDRNTNAGGYFSIARIIEIDSGRPVSGWREQDIYKVDVDFSIIEETAENKPSKPVYILFERIIKDKFLTNLFFLLSNKVDYRMLYVIYDDIRFFLKEDRDKDFLSEFKAPLNRFTHTANNYEVLGFYARHGRTSNEPPAAPMNLDDSRNLIFDIIAKLLREKFNISLPDFWGMAYV